MPLKDGSPEDYKQAAVRHYVDATQLEAEGRYDNAGHLIGFAAECAIKHKIEITTGDDVLQHLPDLLLPARKRLGTRANFTGMYDLLKADPLPGWSVDHRYARDGKVDKNALDVWLQNTRRLMAAAGLKLKVD